MEELLQVRNLTVEYQTDVEQAFVVVSDVSFDIASGETVGLMGESGCGKSSVALALLGLLPSKIAHVSGSVRFEGLNLLTIDERALQKMRGTAISVIYQEPTISLSPMVRVGIQVTEVIHAHRRWGWKRCKIEAQQTLERVGLRSLDRIFSAYPHQLSGGQCQRVVLAQALACGPRLLIADEPTAHLDARSQAEFLGLLEELRKQSGISILLISHAPEVQARLVNRLLVMKAGQIIEDGPFSKLYRNPSLDYTRAMLRSKPLAPAQPENSNETSAEAQLTS
jgi:ABC-type glutathione transport system ATPase component